MCDAKETKQQLYKKYQNRALGGEEKGRGKSDVLLFDHLATCWPRYGTVFI
jgi:hypothetical protein